MTLRFDSVGAKEFGDVTKDNVATASPSCSTSRSITRPSIREPILGGTGQIDGNFTSQSANDLAILLRAGALPAPLKPIEDAHRRRRARRGLRSSVAGFRRSPASCWSSLFMIGRYGLFGVFADVALAFNMVLLMAVADRCWARR